MKYINLELNPALLYTTYDRKHSFYEDVLPSERVEAQGVMPANVFDLEPDEYIIKDGKVLKLTGPEQYAINIKDGKIFKLTLTKNNNKKLKK